jgi:hypothetical protein
MSKTVVFVLRFRKSAFGHPKERIKRIWRWATQALNNSILAYTEKLDYKGEGCVCEELSISLPIELTAFSF